MTDRAEVLLEVTELVKSYTQESGGFLAGLLGGGGQRVPALNGITFQLREGEVLGLTGESGSGKSALARIIAGQEKPDSGKVVFQGKTISAMNENELKSVRGNLRYLAENAFADLTSDPKNRVDRLLYDILERYPAAASRGGGKATANEMLRRVGLGEQYLTRFTSQMSGGEKQRLAIARALMLRPALIVADEPVSNLDLNTRTEMLNLMKRLGKQFKIAFIFISHSPSMVRYFATGGQIGVMFAGRVVEWVPTHSFFDRATHPYTRTLLEANPAPSPLPGGALDLSTIFNEEERVEADATPFRTLEQELSADGNIAASAQLAANRPGCPFTRWCPERFEPCPQITPQLLPVVRRRDESGQYVELLPAEREAEHQAACLRYIEQGPD